MIGRIFPRNLTQFGIWYKPSENENLLGYSDNDWVGKHHNM